MKDLDPGKVLLSGSRRNGETARLRRSHPAPQSSAHSKPVAKLTQKAYLNAVSSLLDYGARIGVSFVVTPILVSGLGDMLFGVWQILIKMASYMSAADGRPTQALKWVIANYQESGDLNARRRTIGSALGVWVMMLPVLALVGLGVVWLAPVVTQVPADLRTAVRVACSVLVINLALTGLLTIPASVLRGMNLGYKRMGLVAGMNLLGGLLTASAVYLKWGLVGVAVAYLAQTVVTGVLFWYVVKTYLPWFGVTRVGAQEVRRFFGLSVWYAAWNLVDKLLLSSDVVLLGMLLSASAVTDYVLTGYVAQTVVAVVTMMVGAAAPGLGGLIGEQSYDRIADLRSEMLWMSSLVSGVSGSMILLWNRSFIALWVGREHYAGMWVNLLLVLIGVQLLFLRNETYLIDLTLDVRRKVLLGLGSAVLSLGLAALLIRFWGIPGLCLGVLGGRLLLTVAYPSITAAFLHVSLGEQFRPIVRPLFVMVVLFALSGYIGREIVLAKTWIEIVLYAGAGLPFVAAAFFWGGFSSEQRGRLLRRMMSLKPLTLGL